MRDWEWRCLLAASPAYVHELRPQREYPVTSPEITSPAFDCVRMSTRPHTSATSMLSIIQMQVPHGRTCSSPLARRCHSSRAWAADPWVARSSASAWYLRHVARGRWDTWHVTHAAGGTVRVQKAAGTGPYGRCQAKGLHGAQDA